MRRTKIGIVTLAATGLVLAGCGGDDDAGSTPEVSMETSADVEDLPTTDDSEDEGDDDGGDDAEASGDLVDWASDLCAAVAPIQERFGDPSALQPTEAPTDQSQIIAQLQEQFADLGPAFEDARSGVESAGPPPIDGGEEIYDNMLSVLTAGSDAFAELDDELAGLDPNDPEALASLEPIFTEIGEELSATGEELDAAFSQPEMEDAFATAPGCEGMDMAP